MKAYSSSIISSVETDQLIINRDYRNLLGDLDLDSFESIWKYNNGKTVKKIRERSVICITVHQKGKKEVFYLKQHNREFVGLKRFFAKKISQFSVSQGKIEFENICRFREKKLATVVPVAAGERAVGFFGAESFLVTKDFAPYVSLEELMQKRPDFFTGSEGKNRRRILLNTIARYARRMHRNGFNHRDFNATHILLFYDNESNIPEIALFDLQRVEKRKLSRFRWMIKSLARLNYTLPDELFDTEDRIHLFLSYKNKSRLQMWDRLQWFWIKKKTARIKRHTEKMRIRKNDAES
jgi:hypothetical protein